MLFERFTDRDTAYKVRSLVIQVVVNYYSGGILPRHRVEGTLGLPGSPDPTPDSTSNPDPSSNPDPTCNPDLTSNPTTYQKVHRESSEAKAFRAALDALEPEMDGHSYYEDLGYMQR